jgi:hypothetical protein
MKPIICSFSLLFVLLATTMVSAQTTTIDFNNDKVREAPSGFSTALTGRGRAGKWIVMKDPASPNQGNVLAQTDADRTDYRFPVCVYDGLTAKDVDKAGRCAGSNRRDGRWNCLCYGALFHLEIRWSMQW